MIVYWLMFLFVAVMAVALHRLKASQSRALLFATCVVFAVIIGFRHDVGGDWGNYLNQFWYVGAMKFGEALTLTKDPGYYGTGWVISWLGGNIYVLNLFCAMLMMGGVWVFVRNQPRPWLAMAAAVPYLLIVVGMGYTRQSAAIGLAMLGLVALRDGRVRLFVFCVLVGAAFHKSAVLLFPIAALSVTRHRMWTAFWVGVMALLAGWVFVYESTEALWTNYVESDYAAASEGAGIRVAMNALPAVLLLLLRHRIIPDRAERVLWTWLAVFALACFPLLAVSATGVDRVALYLIPLQLFVFSRLPDVFTGGKRILIAFGIVVYYGLVQFVWLNYATHAHAWIPYQFELGL